MKVVLEMLWQMKAEKKPTVSGPEACVVKPRFK